MPFNELQFCVHPGDKTNIQDIQGLDWFRKALVQETSTIIIEEMRSLRRNYCLDRSLTPHVTKTISTRCKIYSTKAPYYKILGNTLKVATLNTVTDLIQIHLLENDY